MTQEMIVPCTGNKRLQQWSGYLGMAQTCRCVIRRYDLCRGGYNRGWGGGYNRGWGWGWGK